MSQSALLDQLLNAMSFRCIGPPRGGRVVAVAGDPTDLATFYFGAVAGGVWKTTDAGVTWKCISDGFFKTSSVGAIEVAPSDPNVIYVGMGETTIRTDVSYGDGVYKSTDAGRTWKHCGLTETRHIGKIVVHPKNPNLVYVAALGHAFGPNAERGVYRSKDGGASWEQVLFKSDRAGAADITMDLHNPDTLYASIWQVYRNFWELNSGGPECGLWQSSDGGDTWVELTHNRGLPKSKLGKIGLAASPVQAGRVWALVEAKTEAGLYRSDDFGVTWKLTCDTPELRRRPWYYMHVVADTQDADTVYVSNLDFHKSTDGGKSFTPIPTPHGDNHALWIDPHNNRRMVQGNDGGACISFNGGESFSTVYNQLTAQLYHLAADTRFPYRVYATQQDNSSISVPSDTISGGIGWGDCYAAGTGESGYIVVDPQNNDVTYVGAVGSSPGGLGALQRYDHSTQQIQLINVWPENFGGDIAPADFKYRFPWTYPILFSPHDPNLLYACGNMAFRSTNAGHSWQPFSPDLTRNDKSKQQPSGGDVTLDNSAAEIYCNIYTFRESPHEAGVFWAGSDDGLVHISRDGGASWQNVTPLGLPEWTWVRTLEPSPFDPGACYLAATRYKLDDTTPYLYKTSDYGQSWTVITDGIPADDYTRVIRADPQRRGLLYCGTETGLYLSLNDGASWQRWKSNLPVTPVFDLLVKGSDLVVGTHGRSIWIVDDLTPLHQLDVSAAPAGATLFAPRPSNRILPDLFADWIPSEGKIYGIGLASTVTIIGSKGETGQIKRTYLDCGEGAPRGALVYYHLPEGVDPASASLSFYDSQGNLVREYKPKPDGYDKLDDKQKGLNPGPWIPVAPGVNRFLWNLRHTGATKLLGNKTAGEVNEGPFAVPGAYQVKLTLGEQTHSAQFTIVNDGRVQTSQADLDAQHAAILRIRDQISAIYQGIARLRDVREQVQNWQKRVADNAQVTELAAAIVKKLNAIEEVLIIPGEQKDIYHLAVRPRLNEALSALVPVIGSADARPTEQAAALVDEYCAQAQHQLAEIESVISGDVAALNALLHKAEVQAVLV